METLMHTNFLSFQNWDGLKLNGTHQPLVSANDANILGGSLRESTWSCFKYRKQKEAKYKDW
jgi:hypothetical protein